MAVALVPPTTFADTAVGVLGVAPAETPGRTGRGTEAPVSPAAWCHPDLHVWSPRTWPTCLWKMLPSASQSTDGHRACPTVTQGRDSTARSSLTLWSRPAAASDPPFHTGAWAGPGGGEGGFLYKLSTPGGTPELLDEIIKCPRYFSPRSVLLEQGWGCGDWGSQADPHTWAHLGRLGQRWVGALDDTGDCSW